MLSALAWMKLPVGAQLLLEVSEDFATDDGDGRRAEQVKASRAAKLKRHSLQSEPIRAALNRFWLRQQQTPDLRHSLAFTARGGTMRERKYTFPGNRPGLDYWSDVAITGDTKPIREALIELFKGEPLGDWIASNPTDSDLRELLLQRVRWNLRASSTEDVDAQLLEAVREFCVARQLPVALAAACRRAIRDKVMETAQLSSVAERVLTSTQLSELIELEIERAMRLLRRTDVAPPAPSSLISAVVHPLPAAAAWLCRRTSTVERIVTETQGASLIWLHGANGVGKSTLSQLLTQRLGGNWGHLDLRALQTDRQASLAAWRELQQFCVGTQRPDGIVIDDLSQAALDELAPRLSYLLPTFVGGAPRIIVTSSREPSPARMLDFGISDRSVILSPYLSTTDIEEMLREPSGPPEEMVSAWAIMILAASGGGHPLLTSAKISSLRSRGWPEPAMVEDFIGTSDSVRATREEARLRLLRELNEFAPQQAPSANALLRRVASVFDRVDLSLAQKLGNAEPVIPGVGDALPVLRGTWIENLNDGYLRVSPLVSDVASDVPDHDQDRFRRLAAEHWLGVGRLDQRTLPLCFWNAFLGKHDYILALLCTKLGTLDAGVLRGATSLLTPLLALGSEGPIYPTNLVVSPSLRLLQFDIAKSTDDRGKADEIAGELLKEIDALPHEDLRVMLSSVSGTKVLLANEVSIRPSRLIEYARRLDDTAPQVERFGGPSIAETRRDVLSEYGSISPGRFLYAARLMQLRSSREFLDTIEALDAVEPEVRDHLLEPLDTALPDGLALFVAGGWANDQLADGDMHEAAENYRRADEISRHWGNSDISVEIACARSVIAEEGLRDVTSSLEIVDVATATFGARVSLVRQKSKVLNHAGRDQEALDQLLSVENEVGGRSPFDRALALRDGAVSAARIGRFEIATRLFGKARESALKAESHLALATGLLVDQAMSRWNGGDRAGGLADLSSAFEQLPNLDPTHSRQNQRVHQFARGVGGLFFHDVEDAASKRPIIAPGGASSLGLKDEPLLDIELKPLADNWRVLHLVERGLGIDLGIKDRLYGKAEGSLGIGIESLSRFIEYRRALSQGNLLATTEAGLQLARLLFVMAKSGGAIEKLDASAQHAASITEIFADPSASEGLRMIPVDVLMIAHLQGSRVEARQVKQLREALRSVLGYEAQIEAVLSAASSRLGPGDHSTQVVVAQIFRLSPEAIAEDPSTRWSRDVLALQHVAHSFARDILQPLLVENVLSGWGSVIQNQRFLLAAPMRNVTHIETALVDCRNEGLPGVAKILLAAMPAVNSDPPSSWLDALNRVANGDFAGGANRR